MRGLPLLCLALTLIACPTKRSSEGVHDTDGGAPEGASQEELCLDRWLVDHGFDAFGAPRGTVYGGGNPLFDERSGAATSRAEFVYAKHPDARVACAPSGSFDR